MMEPRTEIHTTAPWQIFRKPKGFIEVNSFVIQREKNSLLRCAVLYLFRANIQTFYPFGFVYRFEIGVNTIRLQLCTFIQSTESMVAYTFCWSLSGMFHFSLTFYCCCCCHSCFGYVLDVHYNTVQPTHCLSMCVPYCMQFYFHVISYQRVTVCEYECIFIFCVCMCALASL